VKRRNSLPSHNHQNARSAFTFIYLFILFFDNHAPCDQENQAKSFCAPVQMYNRVVVSECVNEEELGALSMESLCRAELSFNL
jgi:hypothetical protein